MLWNDFINERRTVAVSLTINLRIFLERLTSLKSNMFVIYRDTLAKYISKCCYSKVLLSHAPDIDGNIPFINAMVRVIRKHTYTCFFNFHMAVAPLKINNKGNILQWHHMSIVASHITSNLITFNILLSLMSKKYQVPRHYWSFFFVTGGFPHRGSWILHTEGQ